MTQYKGTGFQGAGREWVDLQYMARAVRKGFKVSKPQENESQSPALSPQKTERQGRSIRGSLLVRGLVAIVVVLVPVALGMPAVFVFVPPPVIFTPAVLARFVELCALAFGLNAVASMPFNSLVKFMIGVRDPALAAPVVFGVKWRDSGEKQGCCQYGS